MGQRAYWKGFVKIGLVSFPVKLFQRLDESGVQEVADEVIERLRRRQASRREGR